MRQHVWRGGLAAALVASVAGCATAGDPTRAPDPRDRPPGEAREPSRAAPLTLGLLLPQSGSQYLQQYGALILEGVQLAVDAHEAAGGRPVELRIQDSGATRAGATAAVSTLTEIGAIAAVGPLLPDEVTGAVSGRGSEPLAIVSPSSPDVPSAKDAYSLNAGDTRGAEALARWAVAHAPAGIGILHPLAGDGARQARAFSDAVIEAGGRITLSMSYDSSTTTFSQQMQRLAEAGVQTLFIPASEREIPQIAPQLEYYGLGDVQVLGGDAWTGETLLRTLPTRISDGVVAATPLLRTDDAVAWEDLVGAYEARYRRSLNHPFPALGYDAAGLVLAAVRAGGENARGVAERLRDIRDFRGATGVITVRDGTIERAPFLVRIQDGVLVKLDGPSQ